MRFHTRIGEARGDAPLGKTLCLCVGPAVARKPTGAGPGTAFDGEQSTAGTEHPECLDEPCVEIWPVMNSRDGPQHGGRAIGNRERFCDAVDPRDPLGAAAQPAGDGEHHRCRVNRRHDGAPLGGFPGCSTRAAAHVDHMIRFAHVGQVGGETGHGATTDQHAQPSHRPADPGEPRMVGMLIGDGRYWTGRGHRR